MCVFAFDLLFVDGQPLLQEPLRRRQALLAYALPQRAAGWLELATSANFEAPAQNEEAAGAQPLVEGAACSETREEKGEPQTVPLSEPRGPLTVSSPGPVENQGRDGHAVVPAQRAQHEALEEHLLAALAAGAEGLMLKRLDARSTYEPSKRSDTYGMLRVCMWCIVLLHMSDMRCTFGMRLEKHLVLLASVLTSRTHPEHIQPLLHITPHTWPHAPSSILPRWVKLKRDYEASLRDSLDLVVVGAWWGQGRKVPCFLCCTPLHPFFFAPTCP